jgi:hypothetical protein
MVAAAAGCEKLTVGAGIIEPYPPWPPPHPTSTLKNNPDAIRRHVETRIGSTPFFPTIAYEYLEI